jgi:hypothetical protein
MLCLLFAVVQFQTKNRLVVPVLPKKEPHYGQSGILLLHMRNELDRLQARLTLVGVGFDTL